VIVATRVPILDELPGAPKRDTLRERLPVAYLQQRIEASLRATRLEVLPLAQLALRPAWIASPAWPELVGACARLVREGKVLAWGAVLDELPAEPDLLAEPWLAALSVVYHLFDRRAEALFEAASTHKLAVLARQPLAGGALAGALGPGAVLPPRDDRHALDAAALERIAVAMARLSALVKREPPAARSCDAARAIAERVGRPGQPARPGEPARPEHLECADVAELALRFAIDRAGIALPRLHRCEHVPAAIAAASAPPLSAALVARVLDDIAPAP
jgi:aryl-alcohol dehydrogenase-like predicted oxidoreductase